MSWSIKVDDEARAAAQEAARRSGVSLDEWLRRAIADHAAEVGVAERQGRHDNQLRAVAESVVRLARRVQAMRAEARSAVTDLTGRLGEIEAALGRVGSAARAGAADREALGKIVAMVDRLAGDLDDADESARATIEGLRSSGRAKTMDSTSSVADAIRRLDTSIAAMAERTPPSPVSPPASADTLGDLRARLDDLLAAGPKPQERQPSLSAGLDRTLRNLEARLQEAGARRPRPEEPVARRDEGRARQVETSLAELVDRLAGAQVERDRSAASAEAAVAEALQALRGDMAGLEQRVVKTVRDVADDEETRGSVVRRIDALAAEAPRDRALLNEIRDAIDGLRGIVSDTGREAALLDRLDALAAEAPLDRALLREVRDAIDELQRVVGDRGAETALLDRIDALAAEAPADRALLKAIRAELETFAATVAGTAREETLLQRFDDLAHRLPDRGKLDALGEEVASLRWSLESDDSPQAVSRLEMRVNELARTIETTLSARQSASEAIAVGMASSLADIRGAIEDIAASQGSGPDMAALPGLAANVAELRSALEEMTSVRTPTTDDDAIARLVATVAEIRQSLEARDTADVDREAAALDRVERRLDAMAERLEDALSQIPMKDVIDGLDDRLERLAAAIENLNLRTADPGALDAIRDEIASIRDEIANRESPRVAELEDQVRELATRIEAASRPDADAGQLAALETRIAALADELERAGPRTEALKDLETNLQRLQAGLADGREESVEAARIAAREAVRDFASHNEDHELLEALRQDLDQISKAVGDTGERTEQTIGSLQGALATVVERLGRLEGEPAEEHVVAVAATGTFGPESGYDRVAPAVAPVMPPAAGPRDGKRSDEPKQGKSDLAALRELASSATDPDRKPTDRRADFIAAARRAAQAAVAEADATAQPEPAEAEHKVSPFARIGHAIRNRKKPLLLAAAAIVLALGAFQVFGLRPNSPKSTAGLEPPEISQPVAVADTARRPAAGSAGSPTVPRVDAVAMVAPPSSAKAAIDLANAATADERFANVFEGGGKPSAASAAPRPVSAAIPQDPGLPLVGSDQLREAASLGDPSAAFEIANRFAEGRDVAKDLAVAAEWYRRAANGGLAVAQYRLGSLYERGQGVDKDLTEAVNWYQRAADQGNIGAMHNLAVMMSEGVGDRPDVNKAVEWFLAAANYGVKDSQYNLGVIYARGLGPEKNLGESYKWFAVAAAAGDKDAAARRDEVAALLSPDELVAARAAVQAWRTKPPLAAANTVAAPEGGWDGKGTGITAADQKALVMKIQALLTEQGYDPGPPDGIEGPKTREAVIAFQRRIGVEANGVIDRGLVAALDNSG
ncbi:peptidoglycan-binding protein [Bauldia litoralis]|nr:peptidoglycan-binding protein [Bauldia litoralis]